MDWKPYIDEIHSYQIDRDTERAIVEEIERVQRRRQPWGRYIAAVASCAAILAAVLAIGLPNADPPVQLPAETTTAPAAPTQATTREPTVAATTVTTTVTTTGISVTTTASATAATTTKQGTTANTSVKDITTADTVPTTVLSGALPTHSTRLPSVATTSASVPTTVSILTTTTHIKGTTTGTAATSGTDAWTSVVKSTTTVQAATTTTAQPCTTTAAPEAPESVFFNAATVVDQRPPLPANAVPYTVRAETFCDHIGFDPTPTALPAGFSAQDSDTTMTVYYQPDGSPTPAYHYFEWHYADASGDNGVTLRVGCEDGVWQPTLNAEETRLSSIRNTDVMLYVTDSGYSAVFRHGGASYYLESYGSVSREEFLSVVKSTLSVG